MQVNDYTAAYLKLYLEKGDRAGYEAVAPALFDHYYRYWGVPGRALVLLDPDVLAQRRLYILDSLPAIEERLHAAGLATSSVEIELMVGQRTSNGHGWLDRGRAVAWMAVEGYPSELMARVFVIHELIHALHYSANGEFYFSNEEEKCDPLRQLLTEGIATYLTGQVLALEPSVSLWADYLNPDQIIEWVKACRSHISDLAAALLSARQSGQPTEMFFANDPGDILKFRSGYYLGLMLIERVVLDERLGLSELLKSPRAEMEGRALELLSEPARLL